MTAPRTTYLLCYDVSVLGTADERRLARVRRQFADVATPLQYSVFLGTFTKSGRNDLIASVARLVKPGRDDVRFYPLPAAPRLEQLGRPMLPDGVFAQTLHLEAAPRTGEEG